jgi:hypothetical protein
MKNILKVTVLALFVAGPSFGTTPSFKEASEHSEFLRTQFANAMNTATTTKQKIKNATKCLTFGAFFGALAAGGYVYTDIILKGTRPEFLVDAIKFVYAAAPFINVAAFAGKLSFLNLTGFTIGQIISIALIFRQCGICIPLTTA